MAERFEFKDSVALITGAGSGLGRATALALAARGCHLALVDRAADRLDETAGQARPAGVRVTAYPLDVSDSAALTALPERVRADHGRINLLMNNAGVALAGTFTEMTVDEFRWLIEINFMAQVTLTHACLPELLRQPQAHIVNVSSIFGIIAPPGQTAYAASKFAVRGFSEALRHELAGTPVTLTVVHPGGVKTRIALDARIAAGADAAQARAGAQAFTAQFRTEPAPAAAVIVDAVARRAPRLLIGADARLMALVQQWVPVAYWPVLEGLFVRLTGRHV